MAVLLLFAEKVEIAMEEAIAGKDISLLIAQKRVRSKWQIYKINILKLTYQDIVEAETLISQNSPKLAPNHIGKIFNYIELLINPKLSSALPEINNA